MTLSFESGLDLEKLFKLVIRGTLIGKLTNFDNMIIEDYATSIYHSKLE